ncbi:pirin family protein [Chitinivibrio alkaliphilus]|uniref:Pirin-like protein n=1 Tax=Chitinivibrio alkaliphilus ACht1 TaxID=1313304 RepID=U7DCB4_9BACT|nr:pirin family protein [Chitinivibrio alkaliphilus]ERP32065.1 Pirin-like protein [Chitinivibrio alkaliphilus ACht1]
MEKTCIYRPIHTTDHWVGDGFFVRSLFTYHHGGEDLSPFLLLDYAEPKEFPPTKQKKGIGEHPHRGFETVTIAYDGEIAHRDSSGGGGCIATGDVQWMTAGAGIVHEEFHSAAFAQQGGTMEMVQLWVNLPRKKKWTAPAYQSIAAQEIPTINLEGEKGWIRPIAGTYNNIPGPAKTHTPMNVWDLFLRSSESSTLTLPTGHTTIVAVLRGCVHCNSLDTPLNSKETALFSQDGSLITLQSTTDTRILILTGEPLKEPIAGRGPFVMNTSKEIDQAFTDYYDGAMGHLS